MPLSSALKSFITACVLATLVFRTVESYNCRKCPINTCHVATQTICEVSQSCFSYRQELYSPGQPLAFVEEKGCSESQCVSLTFSATLGSNITFRYGHDCCSTDLCNQGDFQVPQQSLVPNGFKCPACYSENGMPCDPVPLPCTGAETRCAEVNSSDDATLTIYAKGCVTETGCNLKNINVLNDIAIHTRCVEQRGASSPLLSTASSVLTALILLQGLL